MERIKKERDLRSAMYNTQLLRLPSLINGIDHDQLSKFANLDHLHGVRRQSNDMFNDLKDVRVGLVLGL